MPHSYAEESRTLFALQSYGTLCTISSSTPGFPFGSITPYCFDAQGRIVIYISLIAEHYKNLKAEPRASMLVEHRLDPRPPQERARASAFTVFEEVPAAERDEVQRRYEARFPSSINYEIAHNFTFMRGALDRIRWIGGFGEVGWVSGEQFYAEPLDPVALEGAAAVEHMNDDHADAVKDLARAASDRVDASSMAVMTTIWSKGFTIVARDHRGYVPISIAFPEPVADSEAVRVAIIGLLKRARAGERLPLLG
jgi:hypothetical protein